MLAGLDLYATYTGSAQHIIGAAEDLDDLSVEDLPVDDLSVRGVIVWHPLRDGKVLAT